jgi:hypothetical protein
MSQPHHGQPCVSQLRVLVVSVRLLRGLGFGEHLPPALLTEDVLASLRREIMPVSVQYWKVWPQLRLYLSTSFYGGMFEQLPLSDMRAELGASRRNRAVSVAMTHKR